MPASASPSLPRRIVRRARRELTRTRWTTLRGNDQQPRQLRGQRLRLRLPDAAALLRLAVSGQLTGTVAALDVELAAVPEALVRGVRPPALGREVTGFRWQRRGSRLRVRLGWSAPQQVHRALADVLRASLRVRPWDQLGGPVYALDRTAWQAGAACWPQGRLAAGPPEVEHDDQGRPAAPFLVVPRPAQPLPEPVFAAVANPVGRRLVGTARHYRLRRESGRVVLRDPQGRLVWQLSDPHSAGTATAGFKKYAVVSVDAPAGGDPLVAAAVRTLAASGLVFAAEPPAIRSELDALDAVTVADPAEVTDLPGYALSVAASRRMAIAADPALRRTALNPAGDRALPLPTVTAVISTMRAEHLGTLLGYLAGQTYPALEVVVGLHGYDLPAARRDELTADLPFPIRIITVEPERPFGAVLERLSRLADGELVTKLDDDDHYGPHHVTDLVLAWHATGADVVAKGARFVHLAERDQTIDRAWAALETFDVSPAGGTLLLSRGTLAAAGGWSHSSKHVDTDLLVRVKDAGGVVYRTHALEYAYVRRATGHTFATGFDRLLSQAKQTYPGLPDQLIRPPAQPRVPA
ncbi:MAG TPA: hypothetical protein VIL37_10440 [Natronosporangium sp.]